MKRRALVQLLGGVFLVGCGGPTSPEGVPATSSPPTARVASTTSTPLLDEDMEAMSQLLHLPKRVAFDLPALHHKTVAQIQQLLGPPNWDDSDPHDWDKSDPQPIPIEWDKTYSRDSIMLNIRYFYRTGKVKYFYLEPQYGCVDATPAGVRALLATGNLKPTSRQYRSIPVYYKHKRSSHRYSSLLLVPR